MIPWFVMWNHFVLFCGERVHCPECADIGSDDGDEQVQQMVSHGELLVVKDSQFVCYCLG